MFRWATVLFLCCFGALLLAQTTPQPAASTPATAEKGPAKESAAPAQPTRQSPTAAAAKPTANVQYPLDAFRNFSALMIGSLAGDQKESRIYRLGNLMRTDDGDSYTVTDLTKDDTWAVSPKACLHERHPFILVFPFDAADPGFKIERVPSGKEVVDGHSCTIEDITVTPPDEDGHSLRMRFWEAQDLQSFPVKIEILGRSGHTKTIRYTEVVLAPPDPALFKHPSRCESLAPKTLPSMPAPSPAPKAAPSKPPSGSSQK